MHLYMLQAKKIFWFIIVPFFGYLGYYSQIRPYFLAQHGEYGCGFVDGLVFTLSALVIAVYLMSKTPREGNSHE
ncbi:MAG: hypothetical protein JSV85_00340 [Candidatus Bathyarchaeota archaeon]|nr:MAG: hypothetical protein JSV85_00340 [Candidatus Bathyarchaeota archaeon]